MSVVSFADARADLRYPLVYVENIGRQMAGHYQYLIEDLGLTRRRVERAKTFGKALEHYARGLRRYHEFKGCFTLASHLEHREFKPLIPAHLTDEVFICQSQARLIETALNAPDPWRSATGLANFRSSASSMLKIGIMMAEEGKRASLVLAGGTSPALCAA